MAIYVAELARAGMTPDWLPGVVPRCVPAETKTNQHGERSTTVVVGVERVLQPQALAQRGGLGLPSYVATAPGTDRIGPTRL
jgi:hypothetical protein